VKKETIEEVKKWLKLNVQEGGILSEAFAWGFYSLRHDLLNLCPCNTTFHNFAVLVSSILEGFPELISWKKKKPNDGESKIM